MARKTHRLLIAFVCQECKSQNYISEKSKLNTKDKLVLKKYCRRCRKHIEHKETDKLD